MGYEQSKFGDGSAAGSGNVTQTVSNHYGARDVGKGTGDHYTSGGMRELVMDIDGEMVSNEAFVLVQPQILANARIEDVFLEVSEVFTLGGTSPTVEVGTAGSEATDGVSVTEAQLEAVGVYDLTSALSGSWAAAGGLTSNVTVGLAMGGTSPTSADTGKARLVVRYFRA